MRFELSEATREALEAGIKRGDSIADLTDTLGERVVNTLESKNILYLQDLLNCELSDLAVMRNLGVKSINKLINLLCNYEKVERRKEEFYFSGVETCNPF